MIPKGTGVGYDFFYLEVSWWFSEDRFHSPSWNQKNWTMIMGDDYDRLWFFLKYENYGKEPLIIIIVHQEIIKIIVQKDVWTMIMGDDYDRLWLFLKYKNYGKEPLIIIIAHQEIIKIIVQNVSEPWLWGMTMIPKGTGVDYDCFSNWKLWKRTIDYYHSSSRNH